MFLPPIGTKKAARSQLTTHLSGIGTPSQGLCAQTLSVYAPLEVVGTREKLRELIVFIAPDADTPLDKVRRGHALCCDGSGTMLDSLRSSGQLPPSVATWCRFRSGLSSVHCFAHSNLGKHQWTLAFYCF